MEEERLKSLKRNSELQYSLCLFPKLFYVSKSLCNFEDLWSWHYGNLHPVSMETEVQKFDDLYKIHS